jgi:hypothetical protein
VVDEPPGSPVGGLTSEHHVTSDPLNETHGDTPHLNVQFLTYAVQGAAEPAGGRPAPPAAENVDEVDEVDEARACYDTRQTDR